MRGLCSHTSVDDEDDVVDLKVMKILEQRLRRHTSGTSTYSHTYGDYDDCRNPCSSQDSGSRWRWTGIRKVCSTTACSGGEISHLCSPSGGHTGEREDDGGGGRPRRWWAVARWRRGSWNLCVLLHPWGTLYIGGGVHPYPSTKAAKGGGHGGGG
jgi:hypothetical protein